MSNNNDTPAFPWQFNELQQALYDHVKDGGRGVLFIPRRSFGKAIVEQRLIQETVMRNFMKGVNSDVRG